MNGPYLPPRVMGVIRDAAQEHHVPPGLVLSRNRGSAAVGARREAYRVLRSLGLSYPQIGYYFNRHHTSVMHALRERPRDAGGYSPIPVPDLSGEWAI